MTAKDVAASIARLADPANSSNALSAFVGVLTPDGITAPDDATVVFTLQAPNGNFPYLVSSDNYNAIIVLFGAVVTQVYATSQGRYVTPADDALKVVETVPG